MYTELHCHSAFSFLDGASAPEELIDRAAALGYDTLALTDHDNLCGALVFAHAASAAGLRAITGCELTVRDQSGEMHLTLLVEDQTGYANLCQLITTAHAHTRDASDRRVTPAWVALEQVMARSNGLICLSGCAERGALAAPIGRGQHAVALRRARLLAEAFPGRFWVELQRPFWRGDRARIRGLTALARDLHLGVCATNNVHIHTRRLGPLQDALVAIRTHATLDGCEAARRGNREHVLKHPAQMTNLFAHLPEAVRATRRIAEQAGFDITRDLGYRPPDTTPEPDQELARLCWRLFGDRYPAGSAYHAEARARLDEELALIRQHQLSGFFLLHHEVLEMARDVALSVRGADSPRMTLPPGRGRGSSVGSIVCYLTGLSHIDPIAARLSLGRFLNRELAAVPDIDLDFPRDIRAELLLRLHEHYGPDRCALVAAHATYRARGAIRELGKALGLPPSDIARLATASDGWNAATVSDELTRLPGLAERAHDRRFRALATLARQIAGLPRHLSQHPGGIVICDQPLSGLVPLQPAAMAGRKICQWDKDSCADAGFLKIDLLGLGMLSAVEECVVALAETGEGVDLSRIPLDDADVYAEIQAADTVGVFQIESRAQMQMLLRTQPQDLDDLVVEVALVRPGPIQGGAVHPYIQRRLARRDDPHYAIPYDHPLLADALAETLGVIVFQDQVLAVAEALAGFTPGQAESLRRAMSRRRSEAAMRAQWDAFRDGARRNGVADHIAETVFAKIIAFSAFGFPKAHAAAFALLAYQSAWLRRYHPAAFLCALMNAQPMGFYPPASLVRDAQRRGVAVLGPDVNHSAAACQLQQGAVRIGLGYVSGMGVEQAQRVVDERDQNGVFTDAPSLARRLDLPRDRLEGLVASGACDALGQRRQLLWQLGLTVRPVALARRSGHQLALDVTLGETPLLSEPGEWELLVADYAHTGLSLREHPIAVIRRDLDGVVSSADLARLASGTPVVMPGLAIARQRPASANGVVFLLLEDEHGLANLILLPAVYERYRLLARTEPLLLVEGVLERRERNINVMVEQLSPLETPSRRTLRRRVSDLRAVAPPAQHFAQGRRR